MYNYQYCQKIVLFNNDFTKVLLAKRRGEQDYDGVFSFIGGKLQHSDESLLAGLEREKQEEIGTDCTISVWLEGTYNEYFVKQDGSRMILPHHLAQFKEGEIELNPEEYAEYVWAPVEQLHEYEPLIPNIPDVAAYMLAARNVITGYPAQVI